jgi:lipopolysaccharide transport system permease protein
VRSDSIPVPEVLIRPARGFVPLDLAEIWEYRELLYFLIWRDIKVRYKQTVLGAAWAVLQPVLTMAIFSLVFGRLAKIPSDGFPYPVFVFAALLPWQLFAHALNESGQSLVAHQHLITKVYFPRLLLPIAAVVAGLVDFAIAFVVLLLLLARAGIAPTAALATLPAFVVLAILTALAVGVWLAALNVRYRDVRYTLPFLTQAWLFITPIAYPASLFPERIRPLLGLNPMAGVEGFRHALLGTPGGARARPGVSAAVVAILLVGGLFYFRRVERTFADVV